MFSRIFTIMLSTSTLGIATGYVTMSSAKTAPSVYRDLNRNGRMDLYEDRGQTPERRADDLLKRMTLKEKVATMIHGTLPSADVLGPSGWGYDLLAARKLIREGGVTSFITRLTASPAILAEQNNAVQKIAAEGRLGIPLTISSDPRNHFQAVLGASTRGGGFSLWPETLGFAAIGDPALVRRFGNIARREYRAVGIHMALSPQADLASEPRWPRVTATFGSDPVTVSRLVGAYVAGFQGGGDGLKANGVATVVKHWVGYGAQLNGFDGHNFYGRVAVLDNRSFAQHVAAFDGAFAAKASGVMPTYPIVTGVTLSDRPLEAVGAGFSRQLLTDLLRSQKGFQGMILSDWAITNDCPESCYAPTKAAPQERGAIAMPWGVENLTPAARFAKGVAAGIDQFGGVNDSTPLLNAVQANTVTEARIDASVRRIMEIKFRLGLFDNPFVDPTAAVRIISDASAHADADMAQRRAQVVLENKDGLLPLTSASRRVWLYRVDPAVARMQGFTPVDDPSAADLAIVRVDVPSEKLHPNHFFGSRQNEGRLAFSDGDPDYEAIKRARASKKSIVVINLDRPAVLANVRDKAQALIATFGASDAAVLDVLTGKAQAVGRLPFELPSSMVAVEQQDPSVPDDSNAPLYRRGFRFQMP